MEPRLSVPRRATEEDEPGVVALLERAGLPLAGLGDAYLWVAGDEDGGIDGVVGIEVHGGDGLLRSLAVAEHRRGQGLGRDLVEHAVEWARRAGLGAVYALTTDAATYLGATGFAATTRADVPAALTASAELQGACPASATVLVRSLQP